MFAAHLVQEEMLETVFSHETVRKQEVFAGKKKHVPIDGKRHHANQSQKYMAKQVIWSLRKRGELWVEWLERLTAAVAVTES